MYVYCMKSNIIKWWQIIYNPVAVKIFPSSYEKELYEEMVSQSQEEASPALIDNANYNATTGSMSGEYGKKEMNQSEKEQLEAILKSNYSSVAGIEAIKQEEEELTSEEKKIAELCDVSNLSPEEAAKKEEQIKRANEIYERLLNEAKMDEQVRQAEIEAAKQATD